VDFDFTPLLWAGAALAVVALVIGVAIGALLL